MAERQLRDKEKFTPPQVDAGEFPSHSLSAAQNAAKLAFEAATATLRQVGPSLHRGKVVPKWLLPNSN